MLGSQAPSILGKTDQTEPGLGTQKPEDGVCTLLRLQSTQECMDEPPADGPPSW